jgi:hypothetical protein
MFKKLFNSLTGNNDDENKNQNQAQNNYQAPTPDAEDLEEEIEEDEDEETESFSGEVEYDSETLHGTHYTIEQFDTEVARRADKWIAQEKAEDPNFGKKDEDNVYYNYRREVYSEMNGIAKHDDQVLRWEMANSQKHTGIATSGFVKEDDNNPLLEPIHGISLKDYAAMAIKMSQGIEYTEVCKAMGIEPAIWEELNTLWPKRMQQDASFTVTTLYGQYFMEGGDHPKLNHLQAVMSDKGKETLEKIKTDRYYYEELAGARQAAYEYGLDGAQWILDNYGVSLGDFQAVAMEWMTEQNKNFNSADVSKYYDYQQEKQKEYAAKFAAEQGGNVADDVSF